MVEYNRDFWSFFCEWFFSIQFRGSRIYIKVMQAESAIRNKEQISYFRFMFLSVIIEILENERLPSHIELFFLRCDFSPLSSKFIAFFPCLSACNHLRQNRAFLSRRLVSPMTPVSRCAAKALLTFSNHCHRPRMWMVTMERPVCVAL